MQYFELPTTPNDVVEIRHWLSNEAFGIKLIYGEDDIYTIEAEKVFNSKAFEIRIEYNRARKSIYFDFECLEKIKSEDHDFCLELIGYLNQRFEHLDFDLNSGTSTLWGSSLIFFTKDEIDSLEFVETLYRDISNALNYSTLLLELLKKGISHDEAFRMINSY